MNRSEARAVLYKQVATVNVDNQNEVIKVLDAVRLHLMAEQTLSVKILSLLQGDYEQ